MTTSSRRSPVRRVVALSACTAAVATALLGAAPAAGAQSAGGTTDLGSVTLTPSAAFSGSATTMDLRTNSLGMPTPWGSRVSIGSLGMSGEVLDTASLGVLVGAAAVAGAVALSG